jgi:hypothetical protein
MLTKVDLATGLAAYNAAKLAKLVTYQTTPVITDADILFEIDKGTCAVYKVQGELDYEQPAGDYKAVFDCFDNGNTWASPASALSNLFTYIAVPAIEIDFNSFSYGGVTVCNEKWVAGDTVWNDPLAAAPSPNPATVRSIGNVLVYVTIKNNPMGFLYNGVAPTTYAGPVAPSTAESNWKVVFDARMGSTATNAIYYDPNVTATLPNKLALSSKDELDFSIHVKEAMPGIMTGAMYIGCVKAPW